MDLKSVSPAARNGRARQEPEKRSANTPNARITQQGFAACAVVVAWRLSIGRKFTGLTVKSDARWPTMWRIHFAGQVSDMVNLTRAKDAAVPLVRPNGLGEREVAHWLRRETAAEAPPSRFDAIPAIPPHGPLGWLVLPARRATS